MKNYKVIEIRDTVYEIFETTNKNEAIAYAKEHFKDVQEDVQVYDENGVVFELFSDTGYFA